MPLRDVLYLLTKPYVGKKQGATKAEVISRAVEHGDLKSAAADMTLLADEALENAVRQSRAERARLQAEAGPAAGLRLPESNQASSRSAVEGPPSRQFCRHAQFERRSKACFTLSGVNGTSRRRTPVASSGSQPSTATTRNPMWWPPLGLEAEAKPTDRTRQDRLHAPPRRQRE